MRVFTTFPAFLQLPQAGFLDELIGTALLLLLVLAITDERNAPPGANLTGLMIGLVVVAIMVPGDAWVSDQSGTRFRAAAVHYSGRF